VNDLSDFAWIETGFREHRRDARRHTLTWIERRRRCLVDVDLAVGESKNYIGEGSADVDPDPRRTILAWQLFPPWSALRSDNANYRK
jgi:hypothetical protein